MPVRHVPLAFLVTVLWGLNFIAISASLECFPPLFLAFLRFFVVAVPTVFLVPFPQVRLRWLIGYGMGFGTVQFLGLNLGLAAGFPVGLASLVLQSSAPFTVLLSALFLRERLTRRRIIGVLAAAAGLGLVGIDRASATSWGPFLLVLMAGLGWALANLASRKAEAPNPLHLTVWMSLVPLVPLLLTALLVEGPGEIGRAIGDSASTSAIPAWSGLVYTSFIAGIGGTGIWIWLITRHPASVVAPFSMLVPVTGLMAGWLVMDEVPTLATVLGGTLVIGGVLWASIRPGSIRYRHRPVRWR